MAALGSPEGAAAAADMANFAPDGARMVLADVVKEVEREDHAVRAEATPGARATGRRARTRPHAKSGRARRAGSPLWPSRRAC